MLRFYKMCPICGHEHSYALDATIEQYYAWQHGALIQDAMPELPPDEREVLMTGMCFDCQSQVFQ